jgi:hypothetical protein
VERRPEMSLGRCLIGCSRMNGSLQMEVAVEVLLRGKSKVLSVNHYKDACSSCMFTRYLKALLSSSVLRFNKPNLPGAIRSSRFGAMTSAQCLLFRVSVEGDEYRELGGDVTPFKTKQSLPMSTCMKVLSITTRSLPGVPCKRFDTL